MKKNSPVKKKYGYGSSGIGANYIENPSTTIAKNNIMLAQAEQQAASNPWLPIVAMAGQLGASAITAYGPKSPTPGIAAMGKSNASGAIEVEGKEVIETPGGEVAEVKGASHEQGGVDMNVPDGTKIYSKRIEKFGETMAERKKIRERKLTNLTNLLENAKGDVAIKNAHSRSIQALNEQEQADLQTQEMYGMMGAMQEYAYGTNENGTKKYENGTDGTGTKPNWAERQLGKLDIPGTGDLIGMAGNLISAFSPMDNTLANRASDTPNVNAYKDFGKDALEANMAAMEMSAGQKDESLRKITASANGAKRLGRNSARGINQMRALDLATDINSNEANQGAVDSFQKSMQELLGQKSGLENQQDQMVMQGEQNRDLADRQDKDNFYTQLGKDKSSMGEGIQHMGKDLNAIAQNTMATNLINTGVSKHGVSLDNKGKMTYKGIHEDKMSPEQLKEAKLAQIGYTKDANGVITEIKG